MLHNSMLNGAVVLIASVILGLVVCQQDERELKITTIESGTFLYKTEDGNFQGYAYDLAMKIAEKLSVTPSINLVKDNQYGRQKEDGEWTGMIGELMKAEADIAVAPLTITSARKRVVHFTGPFMLAPLGFLYKKPQTLGRDDILVTMFSMFFTFEVWLLFFVSILLALCGLWAVALLIGDEEFSDIKTSVNYIVTSLLFLTPTVQPKNTIVRVYTYFWLVFRMALCLVFILQLVSLSSSYGKVRGEQPFEDFEDLAYYARRGEANVLMLGNGATEQMLASSEFGPYHDIYTAYLRQPKKNRIQNFVQGVEMVRKSGLNVYIGEVTMARGVVNERPCNLAIVTNTECCHPHNSYGVAVNKDSEYLDKVELIMDELKTTGYLAELEAKWFSNDNCPENSEGTYSSAINVAAAKSFFLLILVLAFYTITIFIYSKISGHGSRVPANSVNTAGNLANNENADLSLQKIDVECKA